jgi:hypothetical protein
MGSNTSQRSMQLVIISGLSQGCIYGLIAIKQIKGFFGT